MTHGLTVKELPMLYFNMTDSSILSRKSFVAKVSFCFNSIADNSNGSVVESEEEEESETEAGDQWEQVGPRNKSVVTRAVSTVNKKNSYCSVPVFDTVTFHFSFIQADFNRSPTSEIFTGHIRSLLHKQGLKESATLQPFFTLQLDIQVGVITVEIVWPFLIFSFLNIFILAFRVRRSTPWRMRWMLWSAWSPFTGSHAPKQRRRYVIVIYDLDLGAVGKLFTQFCH